MFKHYYTASNSFMFCELQKLNIAVLLWNFQWILEVYIFAQHVFKSGMSNSISSGALRTDQFWISVSKNYLVIFILSTKWYQGCQKELCCVWPIDWPNSFWQKQMQHILCDLRLKTLDDMISQRQCEILKELRKILLYWL